MKLLLLRSVGFAGFLIFAAFLATFLAPIHFERAGKELIRREVEREVREKVAVLEHPALGAAAGLLATRYRDEIDGLRRDLDQQVPETVAATVARMQDLDCECREWLEAGIRDSYEGRITSLGQARDRLVALAHGKYVEVVEKVLRDLRIFAGANAAAFLLLLAATYRKRRAAAQLLLPGGLLVVATLISSYFYLFAQNWFWTIVHDDYVGYGYVGYMAIIFLFLCDVVMNRARITTRIMNALLNLTGATLSLIPC